MLNNKIREAGRESVELSVDSMAEFHGNQEKNEDRLGPLEERVKELKVQLERLEESVELSDGCTEENEDRLELLEERVAVLKVQNIELKNHLNSVIVGVNGVIQLLNKVATDTPPQLTVQQVYDMYQTQPSTEEDWQEMTDAIKAAEEYEATPAQQLFSIINGLTDIE